MSRGSTTALRTTCAAVAVATIAALALPSAAAAGPARPPLTLDDCFENTAFFPIPSDDARLYLPTGFEPAAAPADQESTTNFYVRSLVCGDPAAPAVEMVTTYIAVNPPKRLAPRRGSELFIVDSGAEGPGAAALEDALCLGSILEDASIDVTQQRAQSPLGFGPEAGVARTSVTSGFLTTDFTVAAEGSTTPMRDWARWFYGDGRTYFDAYYELSVWGIGSSAVTFTQPYLELPPAAGGASVQSLADISITPPRGCKG
ncbi:MAG TPA: hypothetical protein VG318_15265 [Actinomycetota bacterium]|nr:hypothetical protein [Actinomycetota bacterium]